VERALQDLQVLAGGDTASADDAQVGLDRLNDWIDALALEGLTIPAIVRQTWTLGNGTASYVVGTGSTVNVDRPVNPQAIENIGYLDTTLSPTTEILFGRVLTNAEYELIPQKSLTATAPTDWYYDPTTGTTGTLKPFPIPNVSTLQGVIYAPGTLSEVALADTVSLPRGYRRFFRSNLTVELAAAFEKPVPSAIQKIADDSKARIKTSNVRMVDLGFDLGVPTIAPFGAYSILTDS
jgi:hypothetical protein